jgi:serine/threonine-protein kinase RsbW
VPQTQAANNADRSRSGGIRCPLAAIPHPIGKTRRSGPISLTWSGCCVTHTGALSPNHNGGPSIDNKRIEVTLEALLDSVGLAEEMCTRIAGAAGFDDDDCFKIGMSVREGVINAYNYGSQQQREKKIFLTFELTPEKFIVHVRDQGAGFNLSEVPDPLADENLLKSSGRGIFLMRSFMDEFSLICPAAGGGAEIVMAKRLRQPAAKS